jgi:translocation and assembly module TamB
MNIPHRVLRKISLGLSAFTILSTVAVAIVIHTQWFRNEVREQLISAVEQTIGAKVEIGSFNLDVSHLSAVITDFTIHGTEPAGSPPFVNVKRLQGDFRFFTSIHHIFDITYLAIQQPRVNVIQRADGSTNIPVPPRKAASDNSTLQTVVDLAVGRFELTGGFATFNSTQQQLDVRANNLQARLLYNVLNQGYQGRIGLEPLYVLNGRNTPVNFRVDLPVSIEKDRVDIRNGSVSTPASSLALNASVENMNNPKYTAHLNGQIATIDLRNIANLPLSVTAKGVPAGLSLDLNASATRDAIDVTGLRATLGQTNIEASGRLKGSLGNSVNAGLQFKATLALGELGRIAKVSARPEGTVILNGTAKLDSANRYVVTGNAEARHVSIMAAARRFSDINLVSALTVDPHTIALQGLKLSALGGQFDGTISLADFEKYTVQGELRHLDLQTLLRALGRPLPYDGVISGPLDARGDTSASGAKGIVANAHLRIAPGKRGIPVSGRLNADYNGNTEDVIISQSFIALPHSRLTLSGSLAKQLNIALASRDLNDLLAAADVKGPPPIALEKGQADFNGVLTGSLTAPRLAGHLALARFSLQGRAFDTFGADLSASAGAAAVRNGTLTRGAMRADFNAAAGLRNWSAPPGAPLTANASIANGDLADVLSLAGQPSAGYSGALTAQVRIAGTISNPVGDATLEVQKGTVDNEPFDRIEARVNLTDQLLTIPAAYIDTPGGRADLTAEFHHPRDSFTTGTIHTRLNANLAGLKQLPAASLRVTADASGALDSSGFLLTAVNADAAAKGLRWQGQNLGDITAQARTSGPAPGQTGAQTAAYTLTSDLAGSRIQVTGRTQLIRDYPTNADANIANLPLERLLTLANQSAIPARGTLSGNAHFEGNIVEGTIANPQGHAELDLTRAVIYNEPLDRVHAQVTSLAQSIDVSQLEIAAGASRLNLTAHFDHPAGNFRQGNMRFNITSSHIDLARIHNVQTFRSGLGGTLDLSANGAAAVREGTPPLLFSSLNAHIAATGIAAQGHKFGDLKLTANTSGANHLNFTLASDLAGSAIQGTGDATLTGDYPLNADLSVNNLAWTRFQDLLGTGTGTRPAFEALADAHVTLHGPALKPDQLGGSLTVSRLNLTTLPRPGAGKSISIANQGPLSASLEKGTVTIHGAHLTGPGTNLQATGTASVTGQALNLNLTASSDLGVIQSFDPDLYTSGHVALDATVRGSSAQPLVNGQVTLQNAAFNYSGFGNGLSNANGTIVFNGNTAQIRTLTGESGGGNVSLSGFAGYGGAVRFGLRAAASHVRIRVQPGVSVTADANIRLTGTSDSSVVSGDATIRQVSYAPQSDLGSLLQRAAPPIQAPSAPSPILENMRLDVRVRAASGLAVQASLAQDLQADADLRVRGTAAEPGVVGRVTINAGTLVFFGAQYTVDTGTIAFYNPLRVEPILDISLETQAKGVNVTLRVTGPVDNMKLSYTSDPPLQFQEIVGLLATGKAPTSDPTLLANQPSQPAQSFSQMGESAIVGQALANPVAGRLQRVFGLTQFKIDPSFSSGSDVPTARLTLQQRITSNLTFTYVSAIDDPNSTIVRIEWAFNPKFSAVATRDQNGIFSINFFYKRQFR